MHPLVSAGHLDCTQIQIAKKQGCGEDMLSVNIS